MGSMGKSYWGNRRFTALNRRLWRVSILMGMQIAEVDRGHGGDGVITCGGRSAGPSKVLAMLSVELGSSVSADGVGLSGCVSARGCLRRWVVFRRRGMASVATVLFGAGVLAGLGTGVGPTPTSASTDRASTGFGAGVGLVRGDFGVEAWAGDESGSVGLGVAGGRGLKDRMLVGADRLLSLGGVVGGPGFVWFDLESSYLGQVGRGGVRGVRPEVRSGDWRMFGISGVRGTAFSSAATVDGTPTGWDSTPSGGAGEGDRGVTSAFYRAMELSR